MKVPDEVAVVDDPSGAVAPVVEGGVVAIAEVEVRDALVELTDNPVEPHDAAMTTIANAPTTRGLSPAWLAQLRIK